MKARLLAGVDIGGTKTHIRVGHPGSPATLDAIIPTASWRSAGNLANAADLLSAVRSVYAGGELGALAIGAHGCDSAAECDAFAEALRLLTPALVTVVNDAELLPPAAGLQHGIGLVAGTGSIAVGRRPDGTVLVAGGWGWILGDEGSASGLVREAVRAVRTAADAGEMPDGLFEALCSALDVRTPTELGRRLNAMRGAASLGDHAGAVFGAAQAGSILARTIIREGAASLATLVKRVVDRGAGSRNVVAAGGVIVAQPILFEQFEQALARLVPDAQATLLHTPPVAGAFTLAERLHAKAIIQAGAPRS